jgi:hypothetical protein
MRRHLRHPLRAFVFSLALVALWPSQGRVKAASDVILYGDSLNAGWENWSWDTTVSFGATSPVHGGTKSLAATYTAGWGGLYLHANAAVTGTDYTSLTFWIHGGSAGGQHLRVVANGDQSVDVTAQANTWTQVTIPMSSLGSPATLTSLYWQDTTGGTQATFYLDDITLVASTGPPPPPPPPGAGPALHVNAAEARHAISEDIYGINYADEALATALRLPVRRWGGNSTSRYNWQNDVHNTGSDWYFENIPDDALSVASLPNGSSADQFVEQDRATGTKTLLTAPLLGWVPKRRTSGHPYDCGFAVSKYGAQQSVDSWDTNCGNGVTSGGATITGNSATDTSVQVGPSFVADWIAHLNGRYGTAAQGGVAYWDLDNEPMLWNSTHRDVHPQGTTYDEMRSLTYSYAAAIKTADPSARTLGPVLWGWCAYFYSAADGCGTGADYAAHGNTYFVPWYLQQMQAYETQHGVRILDYLDLHYYPQAGGVALSSAGSSTTQALRLRSTRSLWDPTYADESWISDMVQLIPRMKAWIAANYPGTKTAITEYNWGALDHINGALAQADVLGIFGRGGLDLATLWGPPDVSQPGAYAFRVYRNYDGAGHGFGDVSVSATSDDQARLSIYAAQGSHDHALTIVVINKTANALTSSVSLAGFVPSAVARVYRYSASSPAAIVRAADQAVTATGFSATFPANSITLFVAAPGGPRDFDGDGHADLAVFRPSSGTWFWLKSSTSNAQYDFHGWGVQAQGDVPVRGDFDGDGQYDLAVFRPSTGSWFVLESHTGFTTWSYFGWGSSTDTPMPADYDGDGITDAAVYRPSNGTWYVRPSSGATQWNVAFGMANDVPIAGDFDGDGKADIAVYRPSTGTWFWLKSSAGFSEFAYRGWGALAENDVPAPGDYDGDGITDLCIFRPGSGTWFVLESHAGYTTWTWAGWGESGDTLVPADYDGDGRTDLAVYRPSTGVWYVKPTGGGANRIVPFGQSGDVPILRIR